MLAFCSLFNLGAVELPSLAENFAELLCVSVGRVFQHESGVLDDTECRQGLFKIEVTPPLKRL